jgi:hypothetical protein
MDKTNKKKKDILEKIARYPDSLAINMLSYNFNLLCLSNISKKELKALMRLYLLSKLFNIPLFKDFIKTYLQMRVSVNGQGRKDIIEIITKKPKRKSSQDLLLKVIDLLLKIKD